MNKETRSWLEHQKTYWEGQKDIYEGKVASHMSNIKKQVHFVREYKKEQKKAEGILADILGLLHHEDWEV